MFHVKRNRRLLVPNTYAAKRAWALRWYNRWLRGDLTWSALMGVLWVLEHDGRDDVAQELLEAILDDQVCGAQEGLGQE